MRPAADAHFAMFQLSNPWVLSLNNGRKKKVSCLVIHLGFERWQILRFRKARKKQVVPKIASSRDE